MIGVTLDDRYRLDAELAQGGMGILYRAHDLLLDRDVCVKLLKDDGLGSQGRTRLLHEAQAAARLDHPNIVAVYDVGEADGMPFIVMQLIEGKSLFELHPTGFAEIIGICLQVCSALEHAHTHGIIHRDLKPENVLITPEGVARLSDFGLARSVSSRLSGEGRMVGTVFYMAPEQALGQEVDGRSDLYALGVMLYELTAGRLPFNSEDPVSVITQHLYAPVVPPSTYNQQIPAALEALILLLLNKRPSGRPASAAETARLLENIPLDVPPVSPVSQETPLGFSLLNRIAGGRLVGRQPELTQIHELWAFCQQGNGHLVLISGEPGVGKTHLAHEMIVFAQLNHATVLRAGCYEFEATTPYLPFSEALRDWTAGLSTPELSERLGSTAFDLARLVPEIENRLGPLAQSPALPANEERLRMFDNVARFCQKLGRERGLLVFIDDLHWADNGTIALLHYLLRRLRNERFMILCAYREVELERSRPLSDALVEWNRERLATRIPIGRLTLEACGTMLAALFSLESISDEFTQLIFHETEGNPFFIEEVVKSLIEQGQIYREGDRWQRKEIAELTIPQSVKEAIGRRLNRLSKNCLETLHLAAVLGKIFEFRELAAAADANEDVLLDALEEAETAQLIRSQPGEAFVFTHDKIREVLYGELLSIRRRRLHQRIGEGLLRLYTPDLDPHAQELAHHFIESGDLEKGLQFACSAAQQASRIYAHDEALLYYHRAAECAESLNLVEQQAAIAESIGDIYNRIGPFERAIEAYQLALSLAGSPAKHAELGAKIGATYATIGDERGVAYLKVTLEQLDPLTQVEAKARALAMLGRFHHYRGQAAKAIAYLEDARLEAEPLDIPDLLTDIYSYLCGAYQWAGQLEVSNEWARRTLAYGERVNFPHAMALGYEFLAENAFIGGKWLDSLTYAAHDREIGEKIGSQDRIGWSEMSTAFAYHALGELQQGLAAANRGVDLAQGIGNTRLEVIVRAWRAQIACDLGDDALMQADLEFILTQAGRSEQYQIYDWAYNTLCYVHAVRREWAELLESAEKYEEFTQRRHAHWNALAYIGLGMLPELLQISEEFTAEPGQGDTTIDQAYHWYLMARYHQALGQLAAALQAFTLSIQKFNMQGTRIEHARALVWRAELLLSQDEAALARSDLETARQIFAACGARPEKDRVDQILVKMDTQSTEGHGSG